MSQTYTFREIVKEDELEQIFHLRYDAYRKSRMNPFLKKNENRFDFDDFDLHSHHFGFFYNNEIAGYLRIVVQKEKYFNSAVAKVAVRNGLLHPKYLGCEKVLPANEFDFPFLSYPGVPKNVYKYYKRTAGRKMIIEASRLFIRDEFRKGRTAIALLECAVGAGLQIIGKQKGCVLIDCFTSHEKVYNLFGFKRLPHTREYHVHDLKLSGIALALPLSTSGISQKFNSRIKEGLFALQEKGHIERQL